MGLVEKARDWPGATALHAILTGQPAVATRPKHFFRNDEEGGTMPDSVAISFEPPPTLAHLPRQEYLRLVQNRVELAENQAAIKQHQSGTPVLGLKRILAQRWSDRPADAEPRRELSPSLACRDK